MARRGVSVGDAVKVKWLDSRTFVGWRKADRNDGPAVIDCVGWLVAQNKGHISISTCISEDGSVLDPISIPRAVLLSVRRIPSIKKWE